MSIPIIDQLRPLGNFPAVDASDVQAGDQRLSTVLSNTPTTTYVDAVVENKVDKVEGKGLSTNDYTNAEKNKLSGIEANANNYVHPTTAGNKHIPSGGSAGKILGWKANGEAQWVDDHNTEYSDATTSTHGLMSAADKSKLNGIASGATNVTVDGTLSGSSTNAIQNKTVYNALALKANTADVNAALSAKASELSVEVLADRVSDTESDIDTQTARIDAITSLPSGSTSGDAELMDIRIQSNGNTANSAGTAVRTQIASLSNAFDEATAGIKLEFELAAGFWDASKQFQAYDKCYTAEINVAYNEKYYLTGSSYYQMARVAFLDSSDNCISTIWNSDDTAHYNNTPIIVPAGATKMLIQRYKTQGEDNGLTELLKVINNYIPFSNVKAGNKTVETDSAYLNTIGDQILYLKTAPQTINLESTVGYWSKEKKFDVFSSISAATVNVSGGERYLLSSKSFYYMARVAFLDDSNNCIGTVWSSNDIADNYNTEVVVPSGAVKMLLQRYTANNNYVVLSKIIGYELKYSDETVKSNLNYLNDVSDLNSYPYGIEKSITFESVTGYWSDRKEYDTYNNMSAATVDVNVGERYLLTSKSFYGAARVAFLDNCDRCIDVVWNSNDTNDNYETLIVVPKLAVKMIIQRHNNNDVTLKTVVGYRVVPNLNGIKVTLIGDSITEKNFKAKFNWADYLARWTGATVQNLGISGTGFAKSNPYINRISNIASDTKIIGVAISWNDLYAELPIGNVTDTGTNSLAGYANDFFDALITAFPTTPIIAYSQGPWGSLKPGTETSDSWMNMITQICNRKGVPIYSDMYYGSTLKPWIQANQNEYYVSDVDQSTDTVHPNSKGHAIIATYLINKFDENVVR